MFYVSRRMGSKIGVTDTADGVEEFVSLDKLTCYLARGVQIAGVQYRSINSDPSVKPLGRESVKLLYLQSGMPVRIKIDDRSPWRQCLFVRANLNSVFLFDGTMFEFTFSFIDTRGVAVDTSRNDPIRVSELLRQVQAVS